MVCGGGGNLFERGVGAFISRANKRQLTNKPLIESPSPESPFLSVVRRRAADLVPFPVMILDNASNSFRGGRRWKKVPAALHL